MSSDHVDAESKVSGNQANIPAKIREALDVEDGDFLRWTLDEGGEVRVEVLRRERGTFSEFEGYDGEPTDGTADHDEWGIE